MLKQAYQQGVRAALQDAGIIKQSMGASLAAGYQVPQSWSFPSGTNAWESALNEIPMEDPAMENFSSGQSVRM